MTSFNSCVLAQECIEKVLMSHFALLFASLCSLLFSPVAFVDVDIELFNVVLSDDKRNRRPFLEVLLRYGNQKI
jgi:hypothetical protein